PLFVFIHGGYWQRNEKAMFTAVAEGPLAHGFDVALIGYTLAPEASLTMIVEECRTAIRALCTIAPNLGVPAQRIIVGGWSAGGHLAARMLEMPEVAAALIVHCKDARIPLSRSAEKTLRMIAGRPAFLIKEFGGPPVDADDEVEFR
ncbi:MAG: alpha/beta hydrolase, partial [Proteobacteria bacterium]|nr:alpha/beta hydrolase [Pseudomonadota bacterium]